MSTEQRSERHLHATWPRIGQRRAWRPSPQRGGSLRLSGKYDRTLTLVVHSRSEAARRTMVKSVAA